MGAVVVHVMTENNNKWVYPDDSGNCERILFCIIGVLWEGGKCFMYA